MLYACSVVRFLRRCRFADVARVDVRPTAKPILRQRRCSMKTKLAMICSCVAFAAFASSGAAQAPTKPGPEHQMLKDKFEGDWDATMDFGGNKSKGTAQYKMGIGGLWLLMDFTGDF